METPKTAEEILSEHIGYLPEHLGEDDLTVTGNDVIKAIKEYAEQARREEKERHKKLVSLVRHSLLYTNMYDLDIKAANEALAAAGYGKEKQK